MANIVKVDEIEGCELQWQGRKRYNPQELRRFSGYLT